MNTREKLTKEVEQEKLALDLRFETIEKLPIEEMEIAFPEGHFNHFIGSTYEFTLPMRFELIQKFKNWLKEQHPDWTIYTERQYVWNEKDAGYFFSIRAGVWIDIAFRTNKPGAACIIQQIGFEQKPVFEVICGEGAKEPTFEAKNDTP